MTPSRSGLACAMVLLLAVGWLLPGVAKAQDPTPTATPTATPPPPLIWPLYSSSDADVDAWEAWTESEGNGVTVGVIDQSVDRAHYKFEDRIDEEINVVDPAVDRRCPTTTPTQKDDHGTLVAGLIVAQRVTNPSLPEAVRNLSGLAPGARVRPIRAVNNCGDADIDDIVKGIDAAAGADLPVAVMSLATDPTLPPGTKRTIATKLDAAFARASDTLFVVAAGNHGNDNDVPGREVYPCSSTAENVVCVGMTGEPTERVPQGIYTDAPVCWGNVGKTSVDLFAPGLSIFSTARTPTGGPGYWMTQGTSMAAPLVAAAAALVEARFAMADGPGELKKAVVELGFDAHPDLQEFAASAGRLNAARALEIDSRGIGAGGSAKPWTSCDNDHDSWRDTADNCPLKHNDDQADDDRDGVGNACDTTKRGVDTDADGMGAMDDVCPDAYGLTSNGCPPAPPPPPPPPTDPGNPIPGTPTPTPTTTPTAIPAPEIKVLKVSVTKSKAAKVTIRLSRTAKVSLRLERKNGRKWTRVTTRSVTASMSSKSLTLRPRGKKRLTKGSYRVTASIVGARTRTKSFKVK